MDDFSPGDLVELQLRDRIAVPAKILHPCDPTSAEYICLSIYDRPAETRGMDIGDSLEITLLFRLIVVAREILESSSPVKVGHEPVSDEEYDLIAQWIRHKHSPSVTAGLRDDPLLDSRLDQMDDSEDEDVRDDVQQGDAETVIQIYFEEEPGEEESDEQENQEPDIDPEARHRQWEKEYAEQWGPGSWALEDIVYYRTSAVEIVDEGREWARHVPIVVQNAVAEPLYDIFSEFKEHFRWSSLLGNSTLYKMLFVNISLEEQQEVEELVDRLVAGEIDAGADLCEFNEAAIPPVAKKLAATTNPETAAALLEVLVGIGTEPAFEVIVEYLERHPDPKREKCSIEAYRAYCAALSRDVAHSPALRRKLELLQEMTHPELLEDREMALEALAGEEAP